MLLASAAFLISLTAGWAVGEQAVEQFAALLFFEFVFAVFEQFERRAFEVVSPDNTLCGEIVIDYEVLSEQVFEAAAHWADV